MLQSCARLAIGILVSATVSAPAWGERLPIRTYTTTDGLGSSAVLHILSDSRGFLWFATRNGLSRFDGSQFRTFTTADGLPQPVINHVLETRDHEYWVATNGGGVCRLNDEASPGTTAALFTCFQVGSDFRSNRVNVMRDDRQRRIWLGTDNGLYRLRRDGATWRVDPVPLPHDGDLRVASAAIFEDRAGRIWIALDGGVLRVDLDDRMTIYRIEGRDARFTRAIAERDGVVWLGFRSGLVGHRPQPALPAAPGVRRVMLNPSRPCLHPATGRLAPLNDGDTCVLDTGQGLPATVVQALLLDSIGRLWIATPGGLAWLDDERLETLATGDQTGPEGFRGLAQDRAGHIWMATTTGAMKLATNGLVSFERRDGLGDTRIRRLIEGPQGTLFAVSGEWVINRFDGERFHAVNASAPPGATHSYYSHGAFLDSRDRWWLLTNRGLLRLRDGTSLEEAARRPPDAIFHAANGLPSNNAVRVFEDSEGDLWIATRDGTTHNLSRWTRATDRMETFRDEFPSGQLPIAFAEDHRGGVWIGFEGGGLARYFQGRFALIGTADGAPSDVTSLLVDRAGNLWIGSASAGVSLLRNGDARGQHFTRYTTRQGLSTNNVQCLTDDAAGRLYLGTARGVDRLDPGTGLVKHFSTVDGLASDYVTSALRARDGTLWFGTTDGVSRLTPEPKTPSVPSPVWIGEIRAGGTSLSLPLFGTTDVAEFTIGPGQNHLQIGFFGVAVGTGGTLRYRYRLDTEATWSGPSEDRVVHYAGLGPGRYRFLVEAVTSDGVFSLAPASVRFHVQPPVWRRSWFLGLSISLFGAVAYLWHRLRVRRILELERVRARIAGDLHDDIGGSLSRIAIQSEVARRDAIDPDGVPARRLVEIGDTARSVVESLADVVWSIDPGQDDLASVERRLREYAADILGARGIRWTFHSTGHADAVALDPERRRDLLLLLKEGITNIARHADARVASLHLRLSGGELQAELRDDGRGFDVRAGARDGAGGRGLVNMRLRAERLGGTLTVESSPASGTRFVLRMPLGRRRRIHMRLWRRGPVTDHTIH